MSRSPAQPPEHLPDRHDIADRPVFRSASPSGQAALSQSVTIANGTSSSVTLSAGTLSGTNARRFLRFLHHLRLQPGHIRQLHRFASLQADGHGARSATYGITDSASTTPAHRSTLRHRHIFQEPSRYLPASLSFASINVGSSSAAQSVTITNGTSSSVTLSAGTLSGTNPGDFSVSSTTCGSSLAASATCTASLLFKPTATGARSATYSITDSASTTPLTVALSGTGKHLQEPSRYLPPACPSPASTSDRAALLNPSP